MFSVLLGLVASLSLIVGANSVCSNASVGVGFISANHFGIPGVVVDNNCTVLDSQDTVRNGPCGDNGDGYQHGSHVSCASDGTVMSVEVPSAAQTWSSCISIPDGDESCGAPITITYCCS